MPILCDPETEEGIASVVDSDEELKSLLAELERREGVQEADRAGEELVDDIDSIYSEEPLSEEDKVILDLEMEEAERELCRRNLAPFVARMQELQHDFSGNWHIDIMCRELEILVEGILHGANDLSDLRLLLQMPPRHTKSHTCSKCLPIWFLALHPEKEVIVTGYGQEFINEFGSWAKDVIQSDAFRAIFPDFKLRKDSNAKNRLRTPQGGGIVYAGAGSAITGRGAHLFVIDDPIKGEKDADSEISADDLWRWFWGVARTRLHPGGAMVVIHTRWRVNDLIGKLLQQDQEAEDRGKKRTWRLLDFPRVALKDEYDFRTGVLLRKKGDHLHPARYGQEDWEELEAAFPPRQLLALYQQKPVADEGNLFKVKSMNFYNPADLPKNLTWYIATDLALTEKEENDATCIWPYGVDQHGNIWWHPDFFHGRKDAGFTVPLMLDYAERFDVMHIDIEGGVIAQAIKPAMTREMRKRGKWFHVESPAVTQNKRVRAQSAVAMCERSAMFFPKTSRVDLVVIPELLQFDKGEHDDIVDTVSIAARNSEKHVPPVGFDEGEELEEIEDEEEFEEEDSDIPSLFSDRW